MNILPTFLDFLTEQHEMSGWTNIHTDKTISENLPHAKIIAKHMKEFGITEQEMRHAVDAYQRASNLPKLSDTQLGNAFGRIFDGHYGRFYDDGWIRWHYDQLDVTWLDVTSSTDTLQNGWEHIQKLAQQYDPDSVTISNMHGDIFSQQRRVNFAFDGEDVKQGNFTV